MSRAIEPHVLCAGEVKEFCPITNREYERGSGALSHAEQSANFVREAEILADMPRAGEKCPQTGRAYECSIGATTRSAQSRQFLDELSPQQKAQRQADFEKLRDVEARGRA